MTPQENDPVFRQFAENFRGVILSITALDYGVLNVHRPH
jgi:hypothetical protein